MADENETWPPAPDVASPHGPHHGSRQGAPPKPYLPAILVMWGVTAGQFILQLLIGRNTLGQLLGLVGFVLAVFLVTRPQKVARLNGALRLVVWLLGLFMHLLTR